MKRLVFYSWSLILLTSCSSSQVQSALNTILGNGELTSAEVSDGLKQALEMGITKGADLLSQPGGYFNSIYRIELPPQAQTITERLRIIPGFSNLESTIVEKINRGAEDAARKAAPIFVDAIKQMTFQDAFNILMGADTAATNYLRQATYTRLYEAFNPVIVESLDKFDARKIWSDAVAKYNKIPLIEPANPDLDDYVTSEALAGLFDMVQKEEKNIRLNIDARTTELLKKVFARQDKR